MNLKEIKELIKIIDETEISELNLESDGVKIAIRKGTHVVPTVPVIAAARQDVKMSAATSPDVHSDVSIEAPVKLSETVVRQNTVTITAPMVGTFYHAQSPEAAPFVEVGQRISVGQPVCIIEAMKLMNEIESEVDGKLIQILVENGQPVEYGQPLFIIEK